MRPTRTAPQTARPVEEHGDVDLESRQKKHHAQADVGDQLDLRVVLEAEDLRTDEDPAEDQQDRS